MVVKHSLRLPANAQAKSGHLTVCKRNSSCPSCLPALSPQAVEDTVLSHGGEVWQRDTQLAAGLGERLVMTVALPYLWGLPPAFDSLRQDTLWLMLPNSKEF